MTVSPQKTKPPLPTLKSKHSAALPTPVVRNVASCQA
jgi:hypothetical protein